MSALGTVAVLGAGRIGGGLAKVWKKAGHEVVVGVRDAASEEVRALAQTSGMRVASIEQAVREAAVVVLAVPYGALAELATQAGPWAGKVVIDCTNAVQPGWTLRYGHTTSSAEELAKQMPGAHVFKSFNAQGAENLADPVYDGVPATNFFCGDGDAAQHAIVRTLVADAGFEPLDVGGLDKARLLEPLMLLWIASAQALGTRDVAFRVLRRPAV